MTTCRAIIVEAAILPAIRTRLDKLAHLWIREGADKVFVHAAAGGAGNSPQPIRKYLQGLQAKYRLQGAMLIGDLPTAWYEETFASRDLVYLSDYYFMELAGSWTVGALNVVTGPSKPPPSIPVGRVFMASDTGVSRDRPPVTDLYNRLLRKVIDHRLAGSSFRQGRASAVVSNLGFPGVYAGHLRNLYPAPLPMYQQDGATVDQYRTIVETPYDWLLYYGHSDAGQHQMAGGGSWTPFHYFGSTLRVNTLQFESCAVGSVAWRAPVDPSDPSSALAVTAMSDCFASSILGNAERGVTVFAPSIPGYFDEMTRFFVDLSGGGTYGNAFMRWMATEIQQGEPHYMMQFGDPFLTFMTRPRSTYETSFLTTLADALLRRGVYYD